MPTHNTKNHDRAKALWEHYNLVESENKICHKLIAATAMELCETDYENYAKVNPTMVVDQATGRSKNIKFLDLYPDNGHKNPRLNGRKVFLNGQWPTYIDTAINRLVAQLSDPRINTIIKDEISEALILQNSLKSAPKQQRKTV